jgi:hypothetical protein
MSRPVASLTVIHRLPLHMGQVCFRTIPIISRAGGLAGSLVFVREATNMPSFVNDSCDLSMVYRFRAALSARHFGHRRAKWLDVLVGVLR